MVKLLNPLMMLVFKINYFPGQMGIKLNSNWNTYTNTQCTEAVEGHNQLVMRVRVTSWLCPSTASVHCVLVYVFQLL